MPARKKAAEPKMTVSPEPDQHDDLGGAAPADADVTVIIPDVMEAGTTPAAAPAAPAPTGTGTGGTTAPAPTGGGGGHGHSTTPGASNAYDHSYGVWVVPAPAAAATAPVGSSGYYMGIKTGVDTTPGVYAMLGTSEPRASWPN